MTIEGAVDVPVVFDSSVDPYEALEVAIALGATVKAPPLSVCHTVVIQEFEDVKFYGVYHSKEDAERFVAIYVIQRWIINCQRESRRTKHAQKALLADYDVTTDTPYKGPFLHEICEVYGNPGNWENAIVTQYWLDRMSIKEIIDLYFSFDDKSVKIEQHNVQSVPELHNNGVAVADYVMKNPIVY